VGVLVLRGRRIDRHAADRIACAAGRGSGVFMAVAVAILAVMLIRHDCSLDTITP
jgi:hypothetical protein